MLQLILLNLPVGKVPIISAAETASIPASFRWAFRITSGQGRPSSAAVPLCGSLFYKAYPFIFIRTGTIPEHSLYISDRNCSQAS